MRARLSELGLYAVACLIVAGLTHLIVVLLVPVMATRDAYSRLVGFAAPMTTQILPAASPTEHSFPFADPATALAFCRYDLSDGPVRIRAPVGRSGFASLSFHTRRGAVIYALTDRAATHDRMEAVVATEAQLRALVAADDEDNPSEDLRILSPTQQGYALSRVLTDVAGLRPEAEAQALKLSCSPDESAK